MAKRLNADLSDLMRDGLWNHLTALENRLREESAVAQRDEDARRERRKSALRLENSEALAPVDEESREKPTETDPLYLKHAETVVQVYDSVTERRIAAKTAVRAICDMRPLTSDPVEVERDLQRVVDRLLADKPRRQATAVKAAPIPEDSSQTERLLDKLKNLFVTDSNMSLENELRLRELVRSDTRKESVEEEEQPRVIDTNQVRTYGNIPNENEE